MLILCCPRAVLTCGSKNGQQLPQYNGGPAREQASSGDPAAAHGGCCSQPLNAAGAGPQQLWWARWTAARRQRNSSSRPKRAAAREQCILFSYCCVVTSDVTADSSAEMLNRSSTSIHFFQLPCVRRWRTGGCAAGRCCCALRRAGGADCGCAQDVHCSVEVLAGTAIGVNRLAACHECRVLSKFLPAVTASCDIGLSTVRTQCLFNMRTMRCIADERNFKLKHTPGAGQAALQSGSTNLSSDSRLRQPLGPAAMSSAQRLRPWKTPHASSCRRRPALLQVSRRRCSRRSRRRTRSRPGCWTNRAWWSACLTRCRWTNATSAGQPASNSCLSAAVPTLERHRQVKRHLATHLQGGWGPPRRPLWDGTDYLRTQRRAAGAGGLTALVRCSPCALDTHHPYGFTSMVQVTWLQSWVGNVDALDLH